MAINVNVIANHKEYNNKQELKDNQLLGLKKVFQLNKKKRKN